MTSDNLRVSDRSMSFLSERIINTFLQRLNTVQEDRSHFIAYKIKKTTA